MSNIGLMTFSNNHGYPANRRRKLVNMRNTKNQNFLRFHRTAGSVSSCIPCRFRRRRNHGRRFSVHWSHGERLAGADGEDKGSPKSGVSTWGEFGTSASFTIVCFSSRE